jgi:nucleotide-binding universal stress UspA family protein
MSGIVVGVDDSASSQHALRWAVQEARLRDATLRCGWCPPGSSRSPRPQTRHLPATTICCRRCLPWSGPLSANSPWR